MSVEEMLPPDGILLKMQKVAENLNAAIAAKRKALRYVPEGNLRVAQRGENFYYFHVTDSSKPNGDYLPWGRMSSDNRCRSESEKLARRLAQKSYDVAALEELQRQLFEVERFISRYRPERLDGIYENLHEGRRQLVRPLRWPDEEFAARWAAVPYEGKSLENAPHEFRTIRGERVRSKSELIIADVLFNAGVPYRYEYPCRLKVDCLGRKRCKVFYPDFTCLNVRTRREIIWEHFGLMDDPQYFLNALGKIDLYRANGVVYGDGLIFTKEFDGKSLETEYVQRLVDRFLLEK